MHLNIAIDFENKCAFSHKAAMEILFFFSFLPAVIGLNEGDDGYLYVASDKEFDETNGVPTQHCDLR